MKMKTDSVSGPTSSAGLVRYFDISGGGVEISPEMVVGVAVFFLAAEVVLWIVL